MREHSVYFPTNEQWLTNIFPMIIFHFQRESTRDWVLTLGVSLQMCHALIINLSKSLHFPETKLT